MRVTLSSFLILASTRSVTSSMTDPLLPPFHPKDVIGFKYAMQAITHVSKFLIPSVIVTDGERLTVIFKSNQQAGWDDWRLLRAESWG